MSPPALPPLSGQSGDRAVNRLHGDDDAQHRRTMPNPGIASAVRCSERDGVSSTLPQCPVPDRECLPVHGRRFTHRHQAKVIGNKGHQPLLGYTSGYFWKMVLSSGCSIC